MPLKRSTSKKTEPAIRPVFKRRFLNGVTLIAEPIEAVRTAAIGFWFSCGSRYEQKGRRGISHFAEHMLFKGTKSRSAFDIASAFDRMGGYANAFTEREQVCLYCVIPSFYAEDALDILCDMAEHSVFSSEETERERTVIESEIEASADDPEDAALDAVSKILWPGDPLSFPIAGTVKDVRKLTADSVRSWYADFFQKGELTVCVAGNVKPEALCSRLKKLGQHAASALRQIPAKTAQKRKNGVHFLSADFQQEQFFVLYPLRFPFTLKDYYCWSVLNALIGDTMSSRLFQALRERSGYCYTVYSFFSLYADCGYWCAYACAPKKNAAKILASVRAELQLLADRGFGDDEIRAAKEHVCGEEIINAEDTEHRMKRLARCAFYGFVQTPFDESLKAIRSLTGDELESALQTLLASHEKIVVTYGPELSSSVQKKIKSLYDAD